MSPTIVRETLRHVRTAPPPTTAEVDAMLQAVTVRSIQQELAPEPTLSPEAGWTIAALAVGAAAGCLGAGFLIGGWLAALAGAILGGAAGGVFAVTLWRASDGGVAFASRPMFAGEPAADDLLTGW